MDKLIVVGVDTLAGAAIAQALKDRCEVAGISFRGGFEAEGCSTQFVRAGECGELAAAVEAIEPDWLIYAGSLSAANWDLPASDSAWEHEPAMADSLIAACRRLKAKLIAISSDAVFTGPKMFHEESEPTTSTHRAASLILQCEQRLVEGGALVARTHVYGWARQEPRRAWSNGSLNRCSTPPYRLSMVGVMPRPFWPLIWPNSYCGRPSAT